MGFLADRPCLVLALEQLSLLVRVENVLVVSIRDERLVLRELVGELLVLDGY